MKFRVGNRAGDTLVEVMFAIGIFSLVAITIVSVMTSGTSNVQTALETTMARNEIDAQAEALRFIHSAYISEKSDEVAESDRVYTELWNNIKSLADANYNKWLTNSDSLLVFQPATCSEIYDDTKNSSVFNQNGFIINTLALGNRDLTRIYDINNQRTSFREAEVYPRLLYASGTGSMVDKSDEFVAAEGLYIVPVRDPSGTTLVHDGETTAENQAYYDFYIRSCWYGYGKKTPTTISTLIRLYDPDVDIENYVAEEYVLTYDKNGGSGNFENNQSQDSKKMNGGQATFTIAGYGTLNKGGTLQPYGWSEGGMCEDSKIYSWDGPNTTITLRFNRPMLTLYAVWNCKYKINYAKGLSGVAATQIVAGTFPNTPVEIVGKWNDYHPTLAAAPSHPLYTFDGWNCDGDLYAGGATGPAMSVDKKTITCTAQWTAKNSYNYALYYKMNDGTNNNITTDTANNQLETYHDFIVKAKPSTVLRDGYTFKGWADSASATTPNVAVGSTVNITNNTSGSTASKTLYAVWEVSIPSVTTSNYEVRAYFYGDVDTYVRASSGLNINFSSVRRCTPPNWEACTQLVNPYTDPKGNVWSSGGDGQGSGGVYDNEKKFFPVYSDMDYVFYARRYNGVAGSSLSLTIVKDGSIVSGFNSTTFSLCGNTGFFRELFRIHNGVLTSTGNSSYSCSSIEPKP